MAHLEGASFRWAHLEGAQFFGAYLQEARFRGARLSGAVLIERKRLERHLRFYTEERLHQALVALSLFRKLYSFGITNWKHT